MRNEGIVHPTGFLLSTISTKLDAITLPLDTFMKNIYTLKGFVRNQLSCYIFFEKFMFKKLACLLLTVFVFFSTSVASASAASATLYQGSNYAGGPLNVDNNISCFVDVAFNDVLSSVIVHDGTLTLFSDCNYGQPSVTISADGGVQSSGKYPNASWIGGLNDYFSSIQVDN
ncbi:beta/gamma crystallin-related protein [Moorena producens JHB]|uniref:Beta/gamma crystallin-related protein n=1 Tax=Moorena producens (strain JHB) TaxID=1454205 RepID=A0A1D9G2L9_MOOP1|nr:beta/gamma crystallin-related protein [Moorena producens]AOY81853.1 beta/gamma crystallin-related protein [Moorena producens JHB]